MLIGETKYFKHTNLNLVILIGIGKGLIDDALSVFCPKRIHGVVDEVFTVDKRVVLKYSFVIDYCLRVDASVVLSGEIIRCWLTLLEELHGLQSSVNLISCSVD